MRRLADAALPEAEESLPNYQTKQRTFPDWKEGVIHVLGGIQ